MNDLCWNASCRNHSVLASIPCRPCRDRERRAAPAVPRLPKRTTATVDAGFQGRMKDLNSKTYGAKYFIRRFSADRDVRNALAEGRRLQDSLWPRVQRMWR